MQDSARATCTSQCYNIYSNFYTNHISTRPFPQGNMIIFKQTGKINHNFLDKRQTKNFNYYI